MAKGKKGRTRADQSGSGGTPPASEPPCYDVFISYSSKDKAWVRGELLKRIEQAGLKAFIDFRDFRPGVSSIKEMERGAVTCTKTLVVLTPDYVKSEWCELEEIMVQTLTPANRRLRLIPLLKKECRKPLRIAALTHIDFTDAADLELAWRQLLIALGKPQVHEPPVKISSTSIESDDSRPEEGRKSKRGHVFVSYSHKDKRWLDELRTLLVPLVRQEDISLWDDTKIKPGEKWKDEIIKALASARVAVLLVSRNFLASDFIAGHELPPLLESAKRGGLKIVWILVSDCLFQATPIAQYHAAHDTSRPLDLLSKPRQIAILTSICKTISMYAKQRHIVTGADAHLELASLALARGEKSAELEHARKARELAHLRWTTGLHVQSRLR